MLVGDAPWKCVICSLLYQTKIFCKFLVEGCTPSPDNVFNGAKRSIVHITQMCVFSPAHACNESRLKVKELFRQHTFTTN
jgi:hypothetical protein